MQRGSEETLLTGKKCVKSFPILKDNYLANPHISISNLPTQRNRAYHLKEIPS